MSREMNAKQCSACGGRLQFDINKKLLICDFCGSEFSPSVTKKQGKIDWSKEGNSTIELEDGVGFVCSSCGGEMISDGSTMASNCMYCGNSMISKAVIKGIKRPDQIIPFMIDSQNAIDCFWTTVRQNKYIPKSFLNKIVVKDCIGTYVPFWLFSCNADIKLAFHGFHKRGSFDDVKETIWQTNMQFQKIPVDASEKFDDEFMDAIEPFDYTKAINFTPEYMYGFFAENFDVPLNQCGDRATDRINMSARKELSKVGKSKFTFMEMKNIRSHRLEEDITYLSVPVWMIIAEFEGQIYRFAVNGQTGKVVGKLPVIQSHIRLMKVKDFIKISFLIAIGTFFPLFFFSPILGPIIAGFYVRSKYSSESLDKVLITATKQALADDYVVTSENDSGLVIQTLSSEYLYTLFGDLVVKKKTSNT